MGDPLHLGAAVLAGVEPGAVVARAFGTEVQPPVQLAHDQHVDALGACRSQVGIDTELLPESEQTLLRAYRLALELGEPDRGEQHRVSGAAGRERLVWQRGSLVEDGVAAERVLRVVDAESIENPHRLGSHLGSDAVSGQDGDVCGHPIP